MGEYSTLFQYVGAAYDASSFQKTSAHAKCLETELVGVDLEDFDRRMFEKGNFQNKQKKQEMGHTIVYLRLSFLCWGRLSSDWHRRASASGETEAH